MFLFKPGVELEQIVRAVNDVGAAPAICRHPRSAPGGRRAASRAHRHLMNTNLPLINALPTLGSPPVDTSAATTYTDLNGLAL